MPGDIFGHQERTMGAEIVTGTRNFADGAGDFAWDRLAESKGRYEPTNLFRPHQNMPPAARGSND
jgi:hypothetical protein